MPRSLYECADTIVVRAPARPLSRVPGRTRDDADRDPASFIRRIAADPQFCHALEVSSPDLARALRSAADHPPASARKFDRLVGSITAYQLRMAYRPTPFGLLSGVTLGSFGQPVAGRLGARHLVGLRPDARWLNQVTRGIECDASARLGRVRLTVSAHLHRAKDVFVVRRQPDADAGDSLGATEVRVRATRLIELVIDAAARGVGFGELATCLAAAAPQVPADRFDAMLRKLISNGVLDTDLLPPPGAGDPLGHVLARLSPSGLEDGGKPVPGIAAGLAAIRDRMRPVRAHGTEKAAAALHELRGHMQAVLPGEPLIHADLALDACVRLPPQVAREAEIAAETGWRCASSRRPGGNPSRFYYRAFVDRYGYGQLAPLPDVLDMVTGMLAPAPLARDDDDRDAVLMELAAGAGAGAGRRREISLDETILERLESRSGSRDARLAPASVELHAELISHSPADLESGRFLLAVSPQGGALQAGASLGRFAYLLPAAVRRCVLPPASAAGPGSVTYAEVVFRPRDPRLGNLVARTGWAGHRIPVGLTDTAPADLPVRELAVCADQDRLWLFSPALGQFVEPLFYTMLRPDAAPPAARFLFALASARSAVWRPWRWGPALSLAYRPRVRIGRTILAPASWNIPPELAAAARRDDLNRWRGAVAAWRAVSGVPNWVQCGQDDQRLPLNLDDPVHVDLLRRICRRTPAGTVSELSGGLDAPSTQSWLTSRDGPHTAEVVFPLFRREVPGGHWVSAPPIPHGEHRPLRHGPELPGGSWLYAKIFTPPDLQDEVLRWQRAQLLPAAGDAGVDRWFFIRYHDTGDAGGHHLRIRFHGDPARLRDCLLPALHDWASALRVAGLCGRVTLDTYEPETGHYGGTSMIEAAERAFAADSRWVIDMISAWPRETAGWPEAPEQLAAASLACLAVTLGQLRDQPPWARLTPRRQAMVRKLTDGTAALLLGLCTGPDAQPHANAGGLAALQNAGQELWLAAMRGYRQQLGVSLPAPDSERIAARLLHLHQNRLLGGGFADVDVVLALARAALRKTRAGTALMPP
jgi:lantibiotic biosynthesis protein